ncbi:MAG: transcriptional regulator [Candidatus Marinimicrobia bacterium]|nr:transcriptional regulator [Candidatus Neomarinimicrobiota bacterium]|tara:strand:+ start:742 stop:1269 length:528 start_codon:yes stop_codon:yes gene_type:complete
MLESLVTSKTRIKLLLKFFINPSSRAYLRGLAKEFNESTNSIRVELNRLTKSDLLVSNNKGRTVLYKANTKHTFFKDIQNVVLKYVGIDDLVENMVSKLGDVKSAYIIGDYANGIDSGIIDLVLIGEIKQDILNKLTSKTEALINRKIRSVVLTKKEFKRLNKTLDIDNSLLIWG